MSHHLFKRTLLQCKAYEFQPIYLLKSESEQRLQRATLQMPHKVLICRQRSDTGSIFIYLHAGI